MTSAADTIAKGADNDDLQPTLPMAQGSVDVVLPDTAPNETGDTTKVDHEEKPPVGSPTRETLALRATAEKEELPDFSDEDNDPAAKNNPDVFSPLSDGNQGIPFPLKDSAADAAPTSKDEKDADTKVTSPSETTVDKKSPPKKIPPLQRRHERDERLLPA